MTNSLAIAPQRQRRDFTKKPQKGPTLAAPATPAQRTSTSRRSTP